MKPLNVVLAIADGHTAQHLAAILHSYFREVAIARSLDELRHSVPKHRADVMILDLETIDLVEIELIHRDFPEVRMVCMGRKADEATWRDCLQLGAAECCHPSDIRSIVLAATGIRSEKHGHAA